MKYYILEQQLTIGMTEEPDINKILGDIGRVEGIEKNNGVINYLIKTRLGDSKFLNTQWNKEYGTLYIPMAFGAYLELEDALKRLNQCNIDFVVMSNTGLKPEYSFFSPKDDNFIISSTIYDNGTMSFNGAIYETLLAPKRSILTIHKIESDKDIKPYFAKANVLDLYIRKNDEND